MTIFGDQSWKKIQRFLVNRELDSRKSKAIKKCEEDSYFHTYRSVKAIQSKIYQIKPEVEQEYSVIKDKLMNYDHNIKEHLQTLKKQLNKEDVTQIPSSYGKPSQMNTPNKKILFVSEKVKKNDGPIIKKFKPASK
jgi:hypothetical protein